MNNNIIKILAIFIVVADTYPLGTVIVLPIAALLVVYRYG